MMLYEAGRLASPGSIAGRRVVGMLGKEGVSWKSRRQLSRRNWEPSVDLGNTMTSSVHQEKQSDECGFCTTQALPNSSMMNTER